MNGSSQLNFEENIVLENDFVLLRPLQLRDFDHLIQFSLYEPEIWTYSSMPAIGADGLKQYLDIAIKARNDEKEFPFIVYDKKNKCYAGSTRLYDIQLMNKCLQLGFTWYGKAFQGTGLNKHCKYLLLNYAFETMDIERVEFRADNRNARSIAAMKSIGCKVEGILRGNGWTNTGERRDSIVLSILKEEWFSAVKKELKSKLKK
jgi:RimJ/RimL family protein N-acetyltransferase